MKAPIRHTKKYFWIPVVCSVLAMGLLAGCDEGAHPLAEDSPEGLRTTEAPFDAPVKNPLTVMSRNVYFGGDIGPIFAVGFSDLEALAGAAAGVWAEVQANDFRERVEVLVDEMEEAMPDVIGLQEVAQFVVLGLNRTTGGYDMVDVMDFYGVLAQELGARGLPYSFVALQDNTQVTIPVAGFKMGEQFVPTQLVRLTIRDAVLVRDGLHIVDVRQGNYDKTVDLGAVVLKRGWIKVDAEVDGVPHHFVSTHLETQSFVSEQLKQTEELLAEVVADLDGVTIMMGDFNSDAAAGPGDRSWTPTYDEIRAAGFTDLWAMANPGRSSQGLTCCHDSDLRNPQPGLDERIDFIFIRSPVLSGPHGRVPGPTIVELVGNDPSRKTTPNGLWPSDHAGLVANLWWAPGQMNGIH